MAVSAIYVLIIYNILLPILLSQARKHSNIFHTFATPYIQ